MTSKRATLVTSLVDLKERQGARIGEGMMYEIRMVSGDVHNVSDLVGGAIRSAMNNPVSNKLIEVTDTGGNPRLPKIEINISQIESITRLPGSK